MLQAKRLDLFYASEIGMAGLLKEQNMPLDSVRAILHLKKEYLCLAFSKDIGDARIASWQRALEEAKADGSVEAIYRGVCSEETIREICLPGAPLAH
jgi:ABC-type amino acid transport substrate-binding protein